MKFSSLNSSPLSEEELRLETIKVISSTGVNLSCPRVEGIKQNIFRGNIGDAETEEFFIQPTPIGDGNPVQSRAFWSSCWQWGYWGHVWRCC